MARGIRPLVAGNWKMNGTGAALAEARAIGNGFMHGLDADTEAVLCVPATLLWRAHEILSRTPVRCGGQDCHPKASGAHTGDISAEMLKDSGASHVIAGHSERRTDHGETDALVRLKAEAAWLAGLVAIICVGETEAERKAGQTLGVLSRQIAGSVPEGARPSNTIIAYEPVWAIGTGLTPTVGDVAAAHAHIRQQLAGPMGSSAATTRILYGGSVKPSNARELLAIENVNGALVGGAKIGRASCRERV